MRFSGRIVLILGGNSGIGLATARAFAEEGAKVHITGRDQAKLDAAVAGIPGAIGHRADIADIAASARVVSDIEAADGRIDVLHVNAGVGGFASLEDITQEAWDHVHAINLRGCVFALQQAVRLMGRDQGEGEGGSGSGGGAVVVTGSIGAHGAVAGNATYAAAKAGLAMAMKVFAKELVGRGIRVNMVSPGPIDTPLLYRNPGMTDDEAEALKQRMIEAVPMHRMGEADEVARAVLFLASEEAGFITGANLFVDGGLLELR